MAEFRTVTDDFAVSGQIAPDDVGVAAAQGFIMIINNRPDGEAPGQPSGEAIAAAAAAVGIDYVHIPVVGRPTAEQGRAVASTANTAQGKVLAFCRSGTRSITAWALGQAAAGALSREALIRLGCSAGYDLSTVLPETD